MKDAHRYLAGSLPARRVDLINGQSCSKRRCKRSHLIWQAENVSRRSTPRCVTWQATPGRIQRSRRGIYLIARPASRGSHKNRSVQADPFSLTAPPPCCVAALSLGSRNSSSHRNRIVRHFRPGCRQTTVGMLGVYKKHKQFPASPIRLVQPNLNHAVVSGTDDEPADITGSAWLSGVFWGRRL